MALVAACTVTNETGGDGVVSQDQRVWKVSFGEAPDGEVAVFEATIVAGSCASSDDVYSDEFASDGQGITPGGLSAGNYAIIVRGRDVDCRVVASGCSEFDLPASSDDVLDIRLEPSRPRFACSAARCMDGRCAGGSDPVGSDGGPINPGTDPEGGTGPDGGMNPTGEGGTGDGMVPSVVGPAIYDIKRGVTPMNSMVTAEGVVTGVANNGFFLQVPESEHIAPDHTFEYSAVYVHTADATGTVTSPAVGQAASVRARIQDFFGQTQLHEIESIELGDTDQPIPALQVLDATDIATGGSLAAAYEAALVRVEMATVDAERPAPTQFDMAVNEFSVDGLRINDLFHAVSPLPPAGAVMSISGILRFSHDNSKIEPRSADDLEYHIALKPLANPRVCVPDGASGASSTPALVVELNGPAPAGGAEVTVSSSAAEITVPSSVTIPAGQMQAEITLDASGSLAEPATVTISYQGQNQQAIVNIGDGAVPSLASVEPASLVLAPGATGQLTVTLDCPAPSGGVDYTVASDSSAAGVSSPLTFATGEVQSVIQVTGGADSTATVTVSKDADSLEASVIIQSLIISEVFYNPSGEDSGFEYVEIYNPGSVQVDLSEYTLGYSNDSSLADNTLQLQGDIDPGACFIVGGPNNPGISFGYATDFNPDIQNANGRADGVALYNLVEGSVTGTSLPIDYVMYGPMDSGPGDSSPNNVAGPSGDILVPDVGNTGSGQSIERRQSGWVTNAVPSPGDCRVTSM